MPAGIDFTLPLPAHSSVVGTPFVCSHESSVAAANHIRFSRFNSFRDGLQRRRGLLFGAQPAPAKRGVFCSLVDLQAAINRYVAEHNKQPKPFTWTASPDRVLAAINRGNQVLESRHLGEAITAPPWP